MRTLSPVSQAVASVEFSRLPPVVQREVKAFLAACIRIHGAPVKSHAFKQEAASLRAWKGSSPKSLEKKYYAWRESGQNWRCLINRAKVPIRSKKLPDAFVEHWRSLCLQNGRKCKPAHRNLIAQWRAGRPIPGYRQTPLAEPGTGIPAGWSYANLMSTVNRTTKYERAAARVGRAAAAAYRPKVLSTRVGLRVGEFYQFDDMWHDFKVHVPGQRGARRILSLHALDTFSANLFASGHKPTMYNEETGRMEQLKEKEMLFLLAHVLGNIGYLGEGCTLIAEHGTAAISEDVERLLYDLSDRRIRVERSGMEGRPVTRGMFAGRGKGNFRFKAALESLHNLIHNETADLMAFPGQTGSNSRLNSPDDLHGREKYYERLLKVMDRLPEERAAAIKLPFLDYRQAVALVEQLYDAINNRADHKLEGWEKAGLVTGEWRMGPGEIWKPQGELLALPDLRRSAIEAYLESSDDLSRVRRMTPAEAWMKGQAGLARLPEHTLPQIFGPSLGSERTVGSDHLISFQDRDLDDEPVHFGPYLIDEYGERLLRPGEKFLAYCNPIAPDTLQLCQASGGYAGKAMRVQRVCRGDAEGMQQASGRAARMESQLLEPVVRGQRPMTETQVAARRHNANTLKGDQRRRSASEDFSEIAPDQEQPTNEYGESEAIDSLSDLL